jgi:hypothetical protein
MQKDAVCPVCGIPHDALRTLKYLAWAAHEDHPSLIIVNRLKLRSEFTDTEQ